MNHQRNLLYAIANLGKEGVSDNDFGLLATIAKGIMWSDEFHQKIKDLAGEFEKEWELYSNKSMMGDET